MGMIMNISSTLYRCIRINFQNWKKNLLTVFLQKNEKYDKLFKTSGSKHDFKVEVKNIVVDHLSFVIFCEQAMLVYDPSERITLDEVLR